MSLSKLSPARESLAGLGDGKIANLFYSVISAEARLPHCSLPIWSLVRGEFFLNSLPPPTPSPSSLKSPNKFPPGWGKASPIIALDPGQRFSRIVNTTLGQTPPPPPPPPLSTPSQPLLLSSFFLSLSLSTLLGPLLPLFRS